jgi:hypothetical protein
VRDRFSVIGFTEAEVGFIAAILLLAAFYSKVPWNSQPKPSPTRQTAPTPHPVNAIPDVGKLKAQIAGLQGDVAKLQSELNRHRHIQSVQKPSCIERGIARTFIADVRVFGEDDFEIEGESYDLAGLRYRVSQPLQQAKDAGCVQSILVEPGSGVATGDYIRGRNRLGQFFYPRDALD